MQKLLLALPLTQLYKLTLTLKSQLVQVLFPQKLLLALLLTQLTDAVYLIRNEHQQDMADKARFDERLGTAEDNIDGLWKAQDKMSERIDRMGDNHEK